MYIYHVIYYIDIYTHEILVLVYIIIINDNNSNDNKKKSINKMEQHDRRLTLMSLYLTYLSHNVTHIIINNRYIIFFIIIQLFIDSFYH